MYEPYHEWKNELKAWKHMSDLAANKHGAALLCSLKGDAKKTAQKIDIDKVITAEGWDLILVELDKLYEKDKSASKYSAFDQLIKFRRPADMGLNDYLRKFEILKNQCESFQTVLSDDLLAYCMLESANLSVDKKELVRATLTDMTTKEMREKLRRIFPEIQSTVSAQSSSLMPMVKEEPVFQCSNAGEYSGQSVNSVMAISSTQEGEVILEEVKEDPIIIAAGVKVLANSSHLLISLTQNLIQLIPMVII